MAIARQTTNTELIKPLRRAITERVTLGATTAAAELISLQSDGKYDPAIATGVVHNVAVAVQGGVDGDVVDAVMWGPIEGYTGATVGTTIYVSDTAGEPAETAGTKSAVAGFAFSATCLWVNPQTVSFS